MDIIAQEKTRHELLERLAGQLQEEMIPAVLDSGEDDEPFEVLNILFDELGFEQEKEAYGEFIFYPFNSEEDTVQHFAGAITIAEEIPEENLQGLFEVMTYLNFNLPCGCFAMDIEKSLLSYKLVVPLPVEMEKEALYDEMNVVMGNAISITDAYMDILLQVLYGEMTVQEAIETIKD